MAATLNVSKSVAEMTDAKGLDVVRWKRRAQRMNDQWLNCCFRLPSIWKGKSDRGQREMRVEWKVRDASGKCSYSGAWSEVIVVKSTT